MPTFNVTGTPIPLWGTHSARPTAGSVPDGSTYRETDTGKNFQAQAAVWVETSVVAAADIPASPAEVAHSTTLAPSATISTYGTATTLVPGTGFSSLQLLAVQFAATTIGSETLTYRVTLTFSDASTASVTTTATTTAAKTFNPVDLLAAYSGKGGLSVSSVALDCKSSIGSSTGAVTVDAVAFDN